MIVEDDPGIQKQLKWGLDGYQIVTATNRQEALDQVRRYEPAVVTLDLGLPPNPTNASEGLKTLEEMLKLAPSTKVIIVTGNDDRDNAISAIGSGAYDFYQKPIDLDVLNLIINRAFRLHQLEQENSRLRQNNYQPLPGVIANSPTMLQLANKIEKIAPSNATVLLRGESGTGKEVFARAIHDLSARSDKPFIAVNCAAIPENLLESELFGYEKGAFTGAVKQTHGKIEFAEGGTFFLDEIGDLPHSLQSKLLRFIQERTIERLGGRGEIPVDVRIICATHQDLEALIEQGRFRQDLLFRINEIMLTIPPLRERSGDILLIANCLLKRFSSENNKNIKGFSDEAAHFIEQHAWPGNVRELENKIRRAVIMTENILVTSVDLELSPPENHRPSSPLNLKQVREAAETDALKRALARTDSNISNAAKLLGVTRPTLYSLLAKYGIEI